MAYARYDSHFLTRIDPVTDFEVEKLQSVEA